MMASGIHCKQVQIKDVYFRQHELQAVRLNELAAISVLALYCMHADSKL